MVWRREPEPVSSVLVTVREADANDKIATRVNPTTAAAARGRRQRRVYLRTAMGAFDGGSSTLK